MSTKLHHEIRIDAPVAKVWAVLADLEAVAAYNPGVERARCLSAQREGVGAARRCDFRDGGSVTERITEWEPERAIAFAMSEHPWPMRDASFRMRIETDGAGTRLLQDTDYVFTGDPSAADAVRTQWSAGIDAVTDAFKRHVERSPQR